MVGIYKITNLFNDKIYIGQSIHVEKRIYRHKRAAYNPNDHQYNSPLYRDIRQYGLENFLFNIIEECDPKQLYERERYWISYYDSWANGYNLTLGGNSGGFECTKEKVKGVIHDLETTEDAQHIIADRWNLSEEMVQGINTGRYWKQDQRTYPIRESKFKPNSSKFISKKIYYCIDCGKPIYHRSLRCIDCENKHRIVPIEELPITRDELKYKLRTTTLTNICKEYNIEGVSLRRWCDKFNLPKTKREINFYSDEEWESI